MQTRPNALSLLFVLLFTGATPGAQEPEYEIRRLPFPEGFKTRAVLNDAGVVASMVNVGGVTRGYRYDQEVLSELGLPADADPDLLRVQFIVDINESGVIVGHHDLGFGKRPVAWEGGVPRELAMPNDGDIFWVSGINDGGQIAGSGWPFAPFSPGWVGENGWEEEPFFYTSRDPMRPVLWDSAGELKYVPYPPTKAIDNSGIRVEDINAAGELVYWQWDRNRLEAFHLIPGKTLVRLPQLGYRQGHPEALNSDSWIVGSVRNTGYDERPVVWKDGVAIDLGHLPGHTKGTCVDINEAGVVLGQMGWPFEGDATLFRWIDGEMVDLETRIRPDSGWDLRQAFDINNEGWILGRGTFEGVENELFLLIPYETDY